VVAGRKAELSRGQRSRARWFNTAAFTQTPLGRFGNEAREEIHLPGMNNVDFSATSPFSLEGCELQAESRILHRDGRMTAKEESRETKQEQDESQAVTSEPNIGEPQRPDELIPGRRLLPLLPSKVDPRDEAYRGDRQPAAGNLPQPGGGSDKSSL